MARPGICYQDVKTAATHLLERGLVPSILRVREVLGTGSHSTIADHLKRWQQELANTPRACLPPAVPEALMQAVEQFWQVAVEQADATYHTLRQQAYEQISAAELARDEACRERDQRAHEVTVLHQQLDALQQTLRDTADRLLVEQERRGAAESAVHAAEERALAAARLTEQVRADLRAQQAHFETALAAQQREAAQQRLEAEARLRYERERGEANEARLLNLLDQTRTDAAAARQLFSQERTAWQQRDHELRQQLETVQKECAATRLALATEQAWCRQHQEASAQLQEQLESLRRDYQAAQQHVMQLQGEVAALKAVQDRLEKQIAQQLEQHRTHYQAMMASRLGRHDEELSDEPSHATTDSAMNPADAPTDQVAEPPAP